MHAWLQLQAELHPWGRWAKILWKGTTQQATVTLSRKSFTWLVSLLFFSPLSANNYKYFAAEQINHSVSWIITQIHAKSFTAKWWSGKHLTLLLLSLQANSDLLLSLFPHSFITFSDFRSSTPTSPAFRVCPLRVFSRLAGFKLSSSHLSAATTLLSSFPFL